LSVRKEQRVDEARKELFEVEKPVAVEEARRFPSDKQPLLSSYSPREPEQQPQRNDNEE
jgi:hypothetical protein